MKALLSLAVLIGCAIFYAGISCIGSLFTDLPTFNVLNAIAGLFVLVGVSIIIVILTAIIQVRNEVH